MKKQRVSYFLIFVLTVLTVLCSVDAASMTFTKAPNKDKKVLELGKDLGFNIRKLHKKGITGKGIGIAIIDGYIMTDHIEYKDRLKREIRLNDNIEDKMALHGTAVASLALGKTVGVAPGAYLYYFHSGFEPDGLDWGIYVYKAIEEIIKINMTLPKENKIRVVSLSASLTSAYPDYKKYCDAIELAKQEGIFLVSCNLKTHYGFYHIGLEREPESDPNKVSSYKPMDWGRHSNMDIYLERKKIYPKDQVLFVPYDSRTTADQKNNKDYAFHKTGCPSWTIPYIAGLYALACQVNLDVTPDLFWEKALETGHYVKYDTDGGRSFKGKIINPTALMAKIKAK